MGTPQSHPERVAAAVPDRCKIVALLHDAIEDGHLPMLEAINGLTEEPARALTLLSRQAKETYADYINQIAQATGTPGHIARQVKTADLNDNLHGRPEGPPPPSLRRRYERALAQLQAPQHTAPSTARGSTTPEDTKTTPSYSQNSGRPPQQKDLSKKEPS